jgi:pSer/pThr/pTyr-binding forkhead associated (FHA) protein
MSVLRTIESKLESLFEGVFGRAFRTNVQPVELARKLVKEMDDHRTVSVSRVYVPNEYTIYLAPPDREQFADFEDSLREELQDYLTEHARRENYVLLTPPKVKLETDADLDIGVFGIATRLVRGARPPQDAPAHQPAPGSTQVYKAVKPAEPPVEAPPPSPPAPTASLTVDGHTHELAGGRLVIGRSKECDVQLADPNVSRRHAEVQQDGSTWWLVDLDSTNGIEVRGKRVRRLRLEDGATFTIGSTEIVFSLERAG